MKGSGLTLESIHHHKQRDPEAEPAAGAIETTGGGRDTLAAEMRAAVMAAAVVARLNQNISDAQTDSRVVGGSANPDTESAFTTEVWDISNT